MAKVESASSSESPKVRFESRTLTPRTPSETPSDSSGATAADEKPRYAGWGSTGAGIAAYSPASTARRSFRATPASPRSAENSQPITSGSRP